MNNKVLHTLEFNKIKDQLKACAVSQPAVRMCDNLRPSSNPEWIAKAQNETEAALNRLLKDDRISFGANFDTRELMKGAVIGKVMSPQSIAIGLAAVNRIGQESVILKKVLVYCVLFTVLGGLVCYFLPFVLPLPA